MIRIGNTKCTSEKGLLNKSLGVVFDQRLVWGEHVDSLCKRVLSGLAAIKQPRQDTLPIVDNAVIKPFFDYCDEV